MFCEKGLFNTAPFISRWCDACLLFCLFCRMFYICRESNEEKEKEYNLMREEIYREMYLAIQELPDRCREVFELHLRGKKNEEIAESLDFPVQTVKMSKREAIAYLKNRLRNRFCWFIFMHII